MQYRLSLSRSTNSAFTFFLQRDHPHIARRVRFKLSEEEITDELRHLCEDYWVRIVPVPEFTETTFTPQEMAALRVVLDDIAASDGEDTIGVLMLHGAFHELPNNDKAVVDLAAKLEGYTPEPTKKESEGS